MNFRDNDLNTSILCVDDEEGILTAYRNVLLPTQSTDKEIDGMLARRKQRSGSHSGSHTVQAPPVRKEPAFNVFTASSGEEAIEIVQQELAASRQIAAGFFDMAMPGGIDGLETIKRIHHLDGQMLCAIVTAYTDRSPAQISTVFARQDDWLYFNKPFSSGELEQTAYHLVAAWNQRRREETLISNLEMMQNGLLCILHAVGDINQVPPLVLEALSSGILRHFLKLVDAEDGFIYLSHGKKAIQCGYGAFDGGHASLSLEVEEYRELMGHAMHSKKHALINGVTAAVPLIIGEEVLGGLVVRARGEIKHNSKLLDMFASQAVNMILHSRLYAELNARNLELSEKNKELVDLLDKLTCSERLNEEFKRMSYIDSLTGMPNRRYIEDRLEEEVDRARRQGSSLACLMIDVDHFKKINDTCGHPGGDRVLREVGRVLMLSKRPSDLVGRYGGEEFVMLFMDIDPNDAKIFCERVRKGVENSMHQFGGQSIKVTVSIGCTALTPSENDCVQAIIQRADEALYIAKKEGRNRSVVLPPDNLGTAPSTRLGEKDNVVDA